MDVENPIDYPEDDGKRLLLEEIEVLKSKLQVVEQRQQQQTAQIDQFVRLFYTDNSAGLIHSVTDYVLFIHLLALCGVSHESGCNSFMDFQIVYGVSHEGSLSWNSRFSMVCRTNLDGVSCHRLNLSV